MLKKWLLLIILLYSASCFSLSESDEYIQNFAVDIKVNADGSLDVTENITVRANQRAFKRGIVRSLPQKYTDSYGVEHGTNYDIRSVQMNNGSTSYHLDYKNNHTNIYIGEKNTIIPPGFYTYTILYHVAENVNFLKDADELYWNVTGNGWNFDIQQASAMIHLPNNAPIMLWHGYTGAYGSKNTQYEAKKISENEIFFETTNTLYPHEGFTVAVAWPKGFIYTKPFLETPYGKSSIIIIELMSVLIFYYGWVLFFRMRSKKLIPIIPLFSPPRDLSAPAVRFINELKFDNKTFTAAIIDLAVKNYLTIVYTRKFISEEFLLKKIDATTTPLCFEERTLNSSIFLDKTEINVSKSPGTLDNARKALKKGLSEKYQSLYFLKYPKFLIPGVFINLVSLFPLLFSLTTVPDRELAGMLMIFNVVFITFFSFMFVDVLSNMNFSLRVSSVGIIKNIINSIILGIFLILFFSATLPYNITFSFSFWWLLLLPIVISRLPVLLLFVAVFIGFDYLLFDQFPIATLIPFTIMVLINVHAYRFLIKYTPEGEKLQAEIKGFRLFLSATERYRFEQLAPPQKTLDLFEKYLPYAIALGVEHQWSKQFDEILKSSADYAPAWYVGTGSILINSRDLSSFSDNLSNSLSNSISSVSSASSASGGGGSSGGGGGGGGGGGW